MNFEWELPPALCNIPSYRKNQKQRGRNLHRTNRNTLETNGLLTQIVIHQQKIRTQHSTVKILLGSKRQKPRHPRNLFQPR